MSRITDLHQKAMQLADAAAAALREGDDGKHRALTEAAQAAEAAAAHFAASQVDLEPTRSVLHRSAATLALECGRIREAEKLIAVALSGDPPPEIADELRDLLEDVYFTRHLSLRGVSLEPTEMQMSLEGAGVGFGITSSRLFVRRVDDFEKLVFRTAERKLGREYRESGRRKRLLKDELELYVSAPRRGSFAVTFKLGSSDQMRLPGLDLPGVVLHELLDCLELVNANNLDSLRTKIDSEPYFTNFVALAQSLAPDGEDVRSVGFTTTTGDSVRQVALARPKAQIRDAVAARSAEEVGAESPAVRVVTGRLLVADAHKADSGSISIFGDTQTFSITVPRGMMSDIVKPLFEEQVVAHVRRSRSGLTLESIDPADEDT